MQAKHIQEWSIVRLPDQRMGVLSHHASKGKSIVLLEGRAGVEIKNDAELECVVTAAIGMQEYLSLKYSEGNLTKRAPDLGWACACGATNAQKLSACGFCHTPRPSG